MLTRRPLVIIWEDIDGEVVGFHFQQTSASCLGYERSSSSGEPPTCSAGPGQSTLRRRTRLSSVMNGRKTPSRPRCRQIAGITTDSTTSEFHTTKS